MDYNALAKRIYEQNAAVGWWDDPNRCIFTAVQLISTEVAEATEGERKNLNDDHLPHRKMGEVELADALIRTLDLGGRAGWRYRPALGRPFMQYGNESIGRMHLSINSDVIDLADTVECGAVQGDFYVRSAQHDASFTHLIDTIEKVAKHLGYDLEAAVEEKLAYNAKRVDHKRSERAKENGKKF